MSITLYYHPFTRAAAVVTMLEELGVPYKLEFVDVRKSAHKDPDFLALNPMGKLPMLRDGDALITESAAIGMYLADRYAPGRLAPARDPELLGTEPAIELASKSAHDQEALPGMDAASKGV